MRSIEQKPQYELKPCTVCGVGAEKRCLGCGEPYCDAHLFAPKNDLVSGIEKCLACAKRANEIQFVEAVQKGLSLLFSAGLAAVIIESPNGIQVRYDRPDVNAGKVQQADEAVDAVAVERFDDGTIGVRGVLTREAFIAIADDMGWFQK